MKLFITNKDYFEEVYDDEARLANSHFEPLNSRQIHILAYNQLLKSIDIDHAIPLVLTPPYNNGEGLCIFDFQAKKGDIYYYSYATTVS